MNEILLRSSVTGTKDIDQPAIDALRTLAMDAVQKAKSGHPGHRLYPSFTVRGLSSELTELPPS